MKWDIWHLKTCAIRNTITINYKEYTVIPTAIRKQNSIEIKLKNTLTKTRLVLLNNTSTISALQTLAAELLYCHPLSTWSDLRSFSPPSGNTFVLLVNFIDAPFKATTFMSVYLTVQFIAYNFFSTNIVITILIKSIQFHHSAKVS